MALFLRAFVIFDLEPMSLSFDFVFSSEILKSFPVVGDLDRSGRQCVQVKYIVKEVEDYLKTYSSAGMDISWYVDGIR
ncbi:hypothetical protein Tco_0788599 [Tanacetum coccineum]